MAESKVIAVDIGGTNLRVAVVQGKRTLSYVKERIPKQKDELLKKLVRLISQFDDKSIKGIGVGSPGPLKNGIIKNPPNLPLKNFDLQGFLEKKFKKRVRVENDAACVALAELKFGCKKKNFIILTLGTGIGGGIIINSKPYNGEGYAGELGYLILNNGKILEDLWKDHRKLSKKYFGKILLIKDLLKLNDKKAKKILQHVSKYLGQGIASLIHIFDPEIVILIGGPKETGTKFLNMIRKQTYKHNLLPKKTDIQWSKLKHPGILGASLLVR